MALDAVLAVAHHLAVFTLVSILAIEWARLKRPLTAEIGTWIAAAAYAWLWGSHVWHMIER